MQAKRAESPRSSLKKGAENPGALAWKKKDKKGESNGGGGHRILSMAEAMRAGEKARKRH